VKPEAIVKAMSECFRHQILKAGLDEMNQPSDEPTPLRPLMPALGGIDDPVTLFVPPARSVETSASVKTRIITIVRPNV
jgi:hypothetical protein